LLLDIFSRGLSIPPPIPPPIAGIPPSRAYFGSRSGGGLAGLAAPRARVFFGACARVFLGREKPRARARVWWPSGWPGGLRSQAERAAPYGDMSPHNAANWRPGVMSLLPSISRRCEPLAPYSVSGPLPGIYPPPGGAGSASKASLAQCSGARRIASRSARVIGLSQGAGARVPASLARPSGSGGEAEGFSAMPSL
jgi:hypothetical protein